MLYENADNLYEHVSSSFFSYDLVLFLNGQLMFTGSSWLHPILSPSSRESCRVSRVLRQLGLKICTVRKFRFTHEFTACLQTFFTLAIKAGDGVRRLAVNFVFFGTRRDIADAELLL